MVNEKVAALFIRDFDAIIQFVLGGTSLIRTAFSSG